MKRIWNYNFFFTFLAIALSKEASTQTVFNKVYDYNSNYDFGQVVIQTFDKGFMFIGDPTPSAVYLLKLDNKGDTTWTQRYDFSLNAGDVSTDVIQLIDSSYVICGFKKDTQGISGDIFLMKTNKYGNLLWIKHFGDTLNDYGDAVLQTPDGGFIILGTTYSFSGGNNMDAWLIKTDSNGIIQWDTVIGGAGDDVPEAMINTKDGGFAFTGYKFNTPESNGIWLLKISEKGVMEWSKTYGMNGYAGHSLQQTPDNGFIIGAAEDSINPDKYYGYILKTDSLGNKTWAKSYTHTLYFVSIIQNTDESYVVAGMTEYDTIQGVEGILMKVSLEGDEIRSRYYTKFGGKNNDYIYDMKPTSDGGFVLCGMVTNYGSATGQDMWLVKTDCMGNDTFWDSVNCSLPTSFPENFKEHYNNITENSQLRIYPNPGSSLINIELTNLEEGQNATFKIYDLLGRPLFIHYFTEKKNNFAWDTEKFGNGIYFYTYSKANEIREKGKIIIVR